MAPGKNSEFCFPRISMHCSSLFQSLSVKYQGRLQGQILLSVPMGNFSLVSFAAVVALWTLVILPIRLIRMLPKWKYIQDKNYAILAAMFPKRSCSYGKTSFQVTETSVTKTKISVIGSARLLIWTHRYFKKGKSDKARSRTGLIWRGP